MTTENDTQNDSNQTKQSSASENTQQNRELIDDCFYVSEQRWKTWNSYNMEGKAIITSLTREKCIEATRCYLKWQQEGFPEAKTHSSVVDGKL